MTNTQQAVMQLARKEANFHGQTVNVYKRIGTEVYKISRSVSEMAQWLGWELNYTVPPIERETNGN